VGIALNRQTIRGTADLSRWQSSALQCHLSGAQEGAEELRDGENSLFLGRQAPTFVSHRSTQCSAALGRCRSRCYRPSPFRRTRFHQGNDVRQPATVERRGGSRFGLALRQTKRSAAASGLDQELRRSVFGRLGARLRPLPGVVQRVLLPSICARSGMSTVAKRQYCESGMYAKKLPQQSRH